MAAGTLRGFKPAYQEAGRTQVFVAGGSNEGLSNVAQDGENDALVAQNLQERCAFWNSPRIVEQLLY
jgi:hypothetical protein